ncbi:hypothetical protein NMY22_g6538 [Coprinellus aureogranulatus]|nr:hypothetical protein NMY22_g6538 [Coprinellus aureogranulatus]
MHSAGRRTGDRGSDPFGADIISTSSSPSTVSKLVSEPSSSFPAPFLHDRTSNSRERRLASCLATCRAQRDGMKLNAEGWMERGIRDEPNACVASLGGEGDKGRSVCERGVHARSLSANSDRSQRSNLPAASHDLPLPLPRLKPVLNPDPLLD